MKDTITLLLLLSLTLITSQGYAQTTNQTGPEDGNSNQALPLYGIQDNPVAVMQTRNGFYGEMYVVFSFNGDAIAFALKDFEFEGISTLRSFSDLNQIGFLFGGNLHDIDGKLACKTGRIVLLEESGITLPDETGFNGVPDLDQTPGLGIISNEPSPTSCRDILK